MLAYDDSLLLTTPAIPGEIRRYILKEGEKAVFDNNVTFKDDGDEEVLKKLCGLRN